ncbi:hypothetical protein F5Y14DRAFT_429476 [Nemania sp. NC0429]|nr:hypothetical protein F5Y14DRAFT_429476 [Nemania sp. NC0429]
MPSLEYTEIAALLYTTKQNRFNFSLETPYGLTIQINQDLTQTSLIASLKKNTLSDDSLQDSGAALNQDVKSAGYKYRLFPDWGAGFLWYDTAWHGNPEDEYPVDEDDILARYGNAWSDAYEIWVDQYTEAFSKQECDLGSGEHPFPDMTERRAWVLDGMMLATWLCLQPDVESVEYSPGGEKILFEKQGLETGLRSFLEQLNKYLT